MTSRVIIGTILFFLFIGAVYWGNFPFLLLVFIFTSLALLEFIKIVVPGNKPGIFIVTILLFVIALFFEARGNLPALFFFQTLTVFLIPLFSAFLIGQDKIPYAGMWIFGYLYLSIPAILGVLIRGYGMKFVLLPALTVVVYDTVAFFFGKKFGKHHLAPKLSPSKSVEGMLSGWIFALIFSVLFPNISLKLRLLNGIFIPLTAQIGDLIESGLKRYYRVKDSSRILGPHGGVLDRIDSIYFSVPFYYLMLLITGG